jgi:hypothetical protein
MMIFICSSTLFFNEIHHFSSPREAFITLLSYSLGEFDYTIFDDTHVGEAFG